MRPLNNVGMHYIQREYLYFLLVILSIRLSDKIEKKSKTWRRAMPESNGAQIIENLHTFTHKI